MKKYAYICVCLLVLNSISVFAGDLPLAISKIALKYHGEDTYRIFDVSDGGVFHHDPDSSTSSYGPDLIATLNEDNGLIAGVIVELKWYGTYAGTTGWCNRIHGPIAGVENGTNYLSTPIDLSTVTRKKVTCRVYAGKGASGNEMTVAPTIEENL